jgi:D-alanyl-lipoteichoic acid acyltransferase DltB (MBOAT superfamily)
MAGASVSFLVFAAVVILFSNLWQRTEWRQLVLLTASVAFLYICADKQSLVPLIAFLGLGYVGLKLIESGHVRTATPMVVVTILIYIWLKRYTFLPSSLFLRISYSMLGLSYIFFRIVHLLEDASTGMVEHPVSLVSYLIYTLNFTTLVAGPIQRYQDFDRSQREAKRPSVIRVGLAIERIITGFFKTNVLALVFSMLQADAINQVMAATQWQTSVLQGAVMIASYPFFLYCNFSGYIDIVIGIAMLIGITLPENFDRPFSSQCFIDFWNRWHITLSTWFKTYVYNPFIMALMRRFPSEPLAPLWGVTAFFVTFFLVGAWHGQTSAFLFFGVLQALGVSINKLYQIALAAGLGRNRMRVLTSNSFYIAVCRGLTFTWLAFTLAWSWSSWSKLAGLATAMGPSAIVVSLCLILAAATVGLAIWEAGRISLLRIRWAQQVVLQSRYTRTAWCTALVLFCIAAELLLRQPAPEIIYKAF